MVCHVTGSSTANTKSSMFLWNTPNKSTSQEYSILVCSPQITVDITWSYSTTDLDLMRRFLPSSDLESFQSVWKHQSHKQRLDWCPEETDWGSSWSKHCCSGEPGASWRRTNTITTCQLFTSHVSCLHDYIILITNKSPTQYVKDVSCSFFWMTFSSSSSEERRMCRWQFSGATVRSGATSLTRFMIFFFHVYFMILFDLIFLIFYWYAVLKLCEILHK